MVKSLKEYITQLVTIMGGRAAEMLCSGLFNTTSGATGDMAAATDIARHLVLKCGFGPKTGAISIDEKLFNSGALSTACLQNIDEDIRYFLNEALKCAVDLLKANTTLFDLLVAEVLENEELDQDKWEKLISSYPHDISASHVFLDEKTWQYMVE